MRVVFMGTPEFAVPVLTVLARTHEVVGALTRPDAVRKRGKRLDPSPVKVRALELAIPLIECSKVTDDIVDEVRALEPDAICVAAFGCILPPSILSVPRYGCVNVHASLLPRWRGAAPIARAILAGDEVTGISIMRVEEGLDTGPVCLVGVTPCEGKDLASLSDELAWMGGYLLLEALERLEAGDLEWVEQPADGATYANRIAKGELDLDPASPSVRNLRRVLASEDAHPARAKVGGILLRVRTATLAGGDLAEGEFSVEDGHAYLGCSEGILELREVTPAGKRPMEASAWVRGLHATELSWARP